MMHHVRRAVAIVVVAVAFQFATSCSASGVQALIRIRWAGTGQANKAVSVARCESTFREAATNGQYRGIFQIGRQEWIDYGRGGNVLDASDNIEGAFRLWKARGWRPWACAG